MEKNLTLRLNEEQVDKLDACKSHLREKTYNKTVLRMVDEYFRFNNL